MRRLAAALLLAGAAGQYDPDACESWCARSFPYTCQPGCTGCMDLMQAAPRAATAAAIVAADAAPPTEDGGRMLEAEYRMRGAQIFRTRATSPARRCGSRGRRGSASSRAEGRVLLVSVSFSPKAVSSNENYTASPLAKTSPPSRPSCCCSSPTPSCRRPSPTRFRSRHLPGDPSAISRPRAARAAPSPSPRGTGSA